MPGEADFEGTLIWSDQRPSTVIVHCSDGRWRRHMDEFVTVHLGCEMDSDLIAVPGGIEPLSLFDFVPKDFNFLRRRLDALLEIHGTKRVVAIAHQDCAWYRVHKLGPLRLDLKDRQIRDLKRAAARIRESWPGVAVEAYFARKLGASPERVAFEAVA